jgi:hypothetical protein
MRRSQCRDADVAFTSASIRLNATRAAPTWDAKARCWAGVGSNANRYARTTVVVSITDHPEPTL